MEWSFVVSLEFNLRYGMELFYTSCMCFFFSFYFSLQFRFFYHSLLFSLSTRCEMQNSLDSFRCARLILVYLVLQTRCAQIVHRLILQVHHLISLCSLVSMASILNNDKNYDFLLGSLEFHYSCFGVNIFSSEAKKIWENTFLLCNETECLEMTMHGKSKQSKEISFCFVSFSKISKIHIAQHLSNYMHRMIILTNFSCMHMKHTCML